MVTKPLGNQGSALLLAVMILAAVIILGLGYVNMARNSQAATQLSHGRIQAGFTAQSGAETAVKAAEDGGAEPLVHELLQTMGEGAFSAPLTSDAIDFGEKMGTATITYQLERVGTGGEQYLQLNLLSHGEFGGQSQEVTAHFRLRPSGGTAPLYSYEFLGYGGVG